MKAIDQLTTFLKEQLSTLYNQEVSDGLIQFQKTRKEFDGDLTLVVFPLVKLARKAPEAVANEVGDLLVGGVDFVAEYEVVKGFLNLRFSTNYWKEFLLEALKDEQFGFKPKGSGQQIMLEYSSPNTNKPLHLGHIRNNLLGYSVAKVLEANGHEVIKANLINDRGIHICKSMLAWQKWGNGETPETTGVKGDHLVGKYYVEFDKQYRREVQSLVDEGKTKEDAEANAPSMVQAREMLAAWEAGDEAVNELWRTMNQWVYDGFDVTYKNLGVEFDQFYYESNTYLHGKAEVEKGLKNKVLYQKEDGSVWCDLTEDGLDHKLLLRSDGTSVYMTQDIGTAIQRFEEHGDLQKLIYTVGNEQDYHFNVLFLILGKLGYSWAKDCYHLSYGMVDLPSGKMKSREGTVVDADDLISEMVHTARNTSEELGKLEGLTEDQKLNLYQMLALGALKYFILKVDPKKRMLFDPKESIDFNGNTGPFIQYAHARIQSILKRDDSGAAFEALEQIAPAEQQILRVLHEFPDVVSEAGAQYSPALVANFSYELVKAFNHFYQNHTILKEEDLVKRNFRLQLCEMTGRTLRNAMGLLGIQLPDQM